MAARDSARRLIVNADDFGRSQSINEAVIRAHQEGILTTASLMVNGSAFEQAVRLARENPQLGVGLHLSLVCGRSSLKPTEIPGLVDDRYNFSNHPVWAGLRYFFVPALRSQLRHELHAQFQKFRLTGLPLDHVNGHLHLHLHPTVLSILLRYARDWNVQAVRLTRDRFWLNCALARGRLFYRTSHAIAFTLLASRARGSFQKMGLRHTNHVFGLLQDGLVDEAFLCGLLPRLPAGDSEVYSHPSLEEFPHEAAALISPKVKSLVASQRIQLIRYQDL